MSKIYLIQRKYYDFQGYEHDATADIAFTSLEAAQDYINKLNFKEYYFINNDVELIGDGAGLEEENKCLKERLNHTQENLKRVYQREALYQSTLQNLKNDLTKFCNRIDTTPHSSYQPYREAYYNENKYKKAIEEMVETLNKCSSMSTCFKFNELSKILNEVTKDEHMD